MSNTVTYRDTEVRGVRLVEIEDDRLRNLRALWAGWGTSAIIEVDGRLAIADSCLLQLGVIFRSNWCSLSGVRFGPGGRRRYRWLTEEIVEEIMAQAAPSRKNKREAARCEQIAILAEILIDFV